MKKITSIVLVSFLLFTFIPGNLLANESNNETKNAKREELTPIQERKRLPSFDTPVLSGKKSGNKTLYILAVGGVVAGGALALGGGNGGTGTSGNGKKQTTGTIIIDIQWPGLRK